MNQSVVVIVLLALFTTCFVGSGAIVTLKVIGAAVGSASRDEAPAKPPSKTLPDEDKPPPTDTDDQPIASVDPIKTPEPTEPEEELSPPDEEAEEFVAPLQARGEFAVFHQDKAKVDPWAALQKVVKGSNVKAYLNEAPISAVPPYFELRDLSTEDYAVIAGATLANGRGLSDAVKKALPKAKRVSVIDVTMPLGGAPMNETSKLLLAFAHATGGVMWDEETNEYFSPEAWKTRRVDSWDKQEPNLSLNLKLYEDEADDGVDLRTGGMKHFGLPELVVQGVASDLKDSASLLLFAAAQTLLERKGPVKPGAMEISIPKLKHAALKKQLEGKAAKNAEKSLDVDLVHLPGMKLPTLIVDLPAGGDATQRLETALDTLFGYEE